MHWKQNISYRLAYWKRTVLIWLGFCPRCLSRLNYTTKRRPICPSCGR